MGLNDTEPPRAPGSMPDIGQEIRDSFQAVLDALDAARADLYASDEREGWAESPPPSWSQRSEPAGSAGITHPASPLAAIPVPPPPRWTQPVGHGEGLEDVDPDPPHVVQPSAVEPLRTRGVHQPNTPRDVAVEPLWLRGARLEPVPPPSVGKPPTASGTGSAHAAPPLTFLRPAAPQEGAYRRTGPGLDFTRSATPQRPVSPPESPAPLARAHARKRSRGWRRFTDRRAGRVAGAFGAGAVSGLILAYSLLVNDNNDNPAPAAPPRPPGNRTSRCPTTPLPRCPTTPLPRCPRSRARACCGRATAAMECTSCRYVCSKSRTSTTAARSMAATAWRSGRPWPDSRSGTASKATKPGFTVTTLASPLCCAPNSRRPCGEDGLGTTSPAGLAFPFPGLRHAGPRRDSRHRRRPDVAARPHCHVPS